MEVPERCTTLQNVSGCIIMQLSGDKYGSDRKFGSSRLWGNSEFVYEDYLGYGKNNPPKTKFKVGTWKENKRKLYPIYEDHGSIWHDHFFNDLCTCDVFIPQPHPQIFYKPFVDHFNTCHNIVPYKTDMLDITIARINLFESKQTNKTIK